MEMKKYITDYTLGERLDYINSINFVSLYKEIRKRVNDENISFELKTTINNERNELRIAIVSKEDLKDRCGIMSNLYESVKLETFNSAVCTDKEGKIYYWCTIEFRFSYKDGGSNGADILKAVYKNDEWSFA